MNTISKVETNTIDMGIEPKADLLQLVHDDNAAVAELFFQFTQVEEDEQKQEIFEQIRLRLTLHVQLVEELLYPLVVETADEEDQEEAKKLVTEAEAGNYIASLILDVLNTMEPDDEYFEAKMTILCELTKMQVKREEKEMFDKLRAAEVDFEELGDEAAKMKAELLEEAQSSKSKSKAKTKTSAKSGGQRGASKASAKSAKAVKKEGPANNKKGSSKPTATSKTIKKTTAKVGSGKKDSAKKQTSRSKSSAKTNNKRLSR